MTGPIVADPEAALKEWGISLLGDAAHVCYRLPPGWDLAAKPAVTVLMLDELPQATSESNVMFQLDAWAARKETLIPVKATVLNGLHHLIYYHYQAAGGVALVGASDISAAYQPDTSETVRGPQSRATPRYIITATITLGHGA